MIIAFKVEDAADGAAQEENKEELKVNWKEVEKAVREAYPKIKLTYARGD